jgi:hypothetical protein
MSVNGSFAPIKVGHLLWLDRSASGIAVGQQQTGTPGGIGIYYTSGVTGGIENRKMIGYGTTGDAIMVAAPIMSGNIDMVSGAAKNKFDFIDHIHVPLKAY